MRITTSVVWLVLPLLANAEEPAPSAEQEAVSAEESDRTLGPAVSQDTLAEQRGGDDEGVLNIVHVTGEVTDNSATNVVTGANHIQDGSFANSSGIMSVVQNTGANVLIQNATVVNVQFTEP